MPNARVRSFQLYSRYEMSEMLPQLLAVRTQTRAHDEQRIFLSIFLGPFSTPSGASFLQSHGVKKKTSKTHNVRSCQKIDKIFISKFKIIYGKMRKRNWGKKIKFFSIFLWLMGHTMKINWMNNFHFVMGILGKRSSLRNILKREKEKNSYIGNYQSMVSNVIAS